MKPRVWTLLKFYTLLVYGFMFAPIVVVLILAFNSSQFGGFPIEGFSLRWFYKLAENEAIVRALRRASSMVSPVTNCSPIIRFSTICGSKLGVFALYS